MDISKSGGSGDEQRRLLYETVLPLNGHLQCLPTKAAYREQLLLRKKCLGVPYYTFALAGSLPMECVPWLSGLYRCSTYILESLPHFSGDNLEVFASSRGYQCSMMRPCFSRSTTL